MITSFVTRYGTYTFPASFDQQFKTNFANLVNKTTRTPGADGGFDEYGMGRAPAEVGTVQFGTFLVDKTGAGMQALRDSLKTIAAWGKGRLIDHVNGEDRWCYARVNSIDMNEQRHQNTEIFQEVKLTFQASDPYWYALGNESVWGGGTLWGSALSVWGGSASPTTITNTGTISVSYTGSAETYARVVVKNSSGSTIYDPIIRRTIDGGTVDELRYTGAIATGTELSINPWRHTAVISGVSVLSNLTYANDSWMRLIPGTNTINVYVDGVANVYIRYFKRYT